MHRLALALLVVALATVAVQPAAPSSGAIDLRVAYRTSAGAMPIVRTLHCDPARGTVVDPRRACRRLRALGRNAFASLPSDRVCTQIAGGPMRALVTGRYFGRRVWAKLALTDGCAIARWNGLAFLFPSRR